MVSPVPLRRAPRRGAQGYDGAALAPVLLGSSGLKDACAHHLIACSRAGALPDDDDDAAAPHEEWHVAASLVYLVTLTLLNAWLRAELASPSLVTSSTDHPSL